MLKRNLTPTMRNNWFIAKHLHKEKRTFVKTLWMTETVDFQISLFLDNNCKSPFLLFYGSLQWFWVWRLILLTALLIKLFKCHKILQSETIQVSPKARMDGNRSIYWFRTWSEFFLHLSYSDNHSPSISIIKEKLCAQWTVVISLKDQMTSCS